MNKFCDWLSETKVASVHESFFLKGSLLSSIIIIDQSQSLIIYVGGETRNVVSLFCTAKNATHLMQVVDFIRLMQVANKLYQAC